MLYPLFLILRFSFIPWIRIRIRNGVAALAAIKCSGIAESINERNIFPWYVFFNIIHISVKAFVSRSEVGRHLQDGSVCSRQTFLHALQMIPEQAAGTRGAAGDGEKQHSGNHSEANTRVSKPCGDRAVYEQKAEPNQALDQRVFERHTIMAPPFIVNYDCICFTSIIIR